MMETEDSQRETTAKDTVSSQTIVPTTLCALGGSLQTPRPIIITLTDDYTLISIN